MQYSDTTPRIGSPTLRTLGHFNLDSDRMGHPKKAKVKPTCSMNSDRISRLPQEIKGIILSNLNVEEAVRASILSSAWRNVWTAMPEIFLCDCSFGSSEASPTSARSKFITLVDQALWLHKGPLVSFSIQGKLGNRSYHDILERRMFMLSKNAPSYITIKLFSTRNYKIPLSLFSISNLKYLRLKYCIISLPQVLEGFKWLTVLNLNFFSSTDSNLNNLISSCPLLDVLRLKHFVGINCLNIRAQVLQILEVEGNFEDLHLHAPNLVHAYFTLDNTEAHQSVPVVRDGKSYLNQAFGSLTHIETLTVNGSFLRYLSKGRMLTKLHGVFEHLERICVESCSWDQTEVLAACSLFQNAPMLREIELWSDPCAEAFERKIIFDQDQMSIQERTMDHLVTVTLTDFKGLDCEVAFVGMLLNWAPALEERKIYGDEDDDDNCICMVLKKLLALPRLSDKAKIIVA